jgi:hypothetical protein
MTIIFTTRIYIHCSVVINIGPNRWYLVTVGKRLVQDNQENGYLQYAEGEEE